MKKTTLAASIAALLSAVPAFADEASLKAQIDKLQQMLEQQSQQIKQLQAQVNAQGAAAQAPVATAAPAVGTTQTVAAAPVASTAAVALAPASESDTTIGGYGEIGFNHYSKDSSRSQADLKRFVLFFGHRFNEQWSMNSEVEWEHAVTSNTDKGESEIEQAYLNYSASPSFNIKTGLFLMPFGLLNQSHEPPVFYGVERNEVETRIIPSTWREGGVGFYGTTDAGLAWDAGITTGFDIAKLDNASSPLAASHQELQFAHAHDPAFYGALNYRGIPGFVVGSAVFTGNGIQGNADYRQDNTQPNFSGINGRVTLWDVHSRWQSNGLDLQAVYARGTVGDAQKVDNVITAYNVANAANHPVVPSAFYGWLVQGAYTAWQSGDMSLTPFARYERYNTQAKMPAGFLADPANEDKVTTVGMSFKPLPQLVFKADYQWYHDNSINDRFNLGLGYMF
ncbi:MAG: hypothetical protein JO218_01925 [Burkholderiales bacterium]|nr:hypothetical protein [Burkholderiales bacterium]